MDTIIRYAEIQERMIAPDGSYPVLGRSVSYRSAAFQVLGACALFGKLPESLKPGSSTWSHDSHA